MNVNKKLWEEALSMSRYTMLTQQECYDNILAFYETRKCCEKQIDYTKTCKTCQYKELDCKQEPCCSCYNELIGLPVNPTNYLHVEL